MSEVLLPKSHATATATVAILAPASLNKMITNRGVGSIYLSQDLLNEKRAKWTFVELALLECSPKPLFNDVYMRVNIGWSSNIKLNLTWVSSMKENRWNWLRPIFALTNIWLMSTLAIFHLINLWIGQYSHTYKLKIPTTSHALNSLIEIKM